MPLGCLQSSLPRKVAIYARVSTEHEEQLAALENQKDWYQNLVLQHPEWDIVHMYVDEGITGTSAKKRPQFMQMIKDANNHAFDLILTREVSRFARNTIDTLDYTRKLKSIGVEVFFINDNISTADGDGELRLTIMATLAQEESRKTSLRVKSGQQTSMNKGVYYGNGNILGYDRVESIVDGKKQVDFLINQEQARTVRMIYDMYLDGVGLRGIKYQLEKEGRKTASGKLNWHDSNISKILKNSFYCGIMTYHKEWTPDYLEQKKERNFGEIEYTTVKGTHEPIITEKEFESVQRIMQNRQESLPNCKPGQKRVRGEKPPIDVWTKLLECECGHRFNRKVWHRTETAIQYGYQCYSSIRSGTIQVRQKKGLDIDGVCAVPMIPGWKLQMMAKFIFNRYLRDTVEVIALAETMLLKHLDDPDEQQEKNNAETEQLKDEKDKLIKRLDGLVNMRADGEISRDEYIHKKSETEKQIIGIDKRIEELSPQYVKPDLTPEEEATHEDKIALLRYYLEISLQPSESEDIPDDVIMAFVRKIVVHKDGFDWYLRFCPDNDPKQLGVTGKRKESFKISAKKSPDISSLCLPQDRPPSRKADFPVV